jgi:hypothetical protein
MRLLKVIGLYFMMGLVPESNSLSSFSLIAGLQYIEIMRKQSVGDAMDPLETKSEANQEQVTGKWTRRFSTSTESMTLTARAVISSSCRSNVSAL